jgi:hypothetical protein
LQNALHPRRTRGTGDASLGQQSLRLRLALIGKGQRIKFSRGRRLLVHIAEGHRVQKASLTARSPQFTELPPRLAPERLSLKASLPPSNTGLDFKSLRLSLSNGSLLAGSHQR